MLKPAALLTILIFLIIAPEPDAKDVAEMTADLLVMDHPAALMASENTEILMTSENKQR